MKNELLRHILATIQYRLNRSLVHCDSEFEKFSLGKGSRSPTEILIHMIDLMNWTIEKCDSSLPEFTPPEANSCDDALKIFFEKIGLLDEKLSKKELENDYSKMLIQGPLADMLTHIGQIAMLSRMNGHPVKMEDFSIASIHVKED